MTTIEELREKEIVWKQQMLFWRNKYESLEEKVEKIAKDCPTDTTSLAILLIHNPMIHPVRK